MRWEKDSWVLEHCFLESLQDVGSCLVFVGEGRVHSWQVTRSAIGHMGRCGGMSFGAFSFNCKMFWTLEANSLAEKKMQGMVEVCGKKRLWSNHEESEKIIKLGEYNKLPDYITSELEVSKHELKQTTNSSGAPGQVLPHDLTH